MKKRRIHFNWFDGVFLLLAAGVVLLLWWAFSQRGTGAVPDTAQRVTLRYVLKVAGIREELESRVKTGDTAYEVSGLYELGQVVGIQADEASWSSASVTVTTVDENGQEYKTPVLSPMPGREDLYVTFEADALLQEDGRYYVDGYVICTGTHLKLMTRHFYCEGYCVSVSEVS